MQKSTMRLAVGIFMACAATSVFADIKWYPTYEAAMNQARSANKVVMVEFYAKWDLDGKDQDNQPLANWSGKLEAETWGDPTAQKVANKFIPVRLDLERDGKALATKFHITNIPSVLFLDKDENSVGLIDGYEAADEFVKHANTFLSDFDAFPATMAKYKANPKSLTAITKLGLIYANRYQIGPALNKLAEAEKIDPKNASDKISDLYNGIADYYQNASKYEPAIKYFQKTADTSKVTDKKAYGYLSIAACYFSKDQPADPSQIDGLVIEKVRANFQAAKKVVELCQKLPNLKKEDATIAETDMTQIKRVLTQLGG